MAIEPVVMEGKRIVFRNFAGKEGQYNAEGKRNFNVLLDAEEAELMKADGWNIKYLEPREEGDIRQARLEVSVKFGKGRPPRIILITSKGKTPLGEGEVQLLDWADIINTDLIIRAYEWEVNSKTGVKAYMNAGYFTIREDALELKYADTPDAPDSAHSAITRNAVPDDVDPDEAPF
jgi:hypothetical protein